MFSFQSDDDLPSSASVIAISLVTILLLSFTQSPEGTLTRPLSLFREVLTTLMSCRSESGRGSGRGSEGPPPHDQADVLSPEPHTGRLELEQRGPPPATPPTVRTTRSARAREVPNPNSTSDIRRATIHSIICQAMDPDPDPDPNPDSDGDHATDSQTITLISAVDKVATQIAKHDLSLLLEMDISDTVDHPNLNDILDERTNTHCFQIAGLAPSGQSLLDHSNAGLRFQQREGLHPLNRLARRTAAARALKTEVLSALMNTLQVTALGRLGLGLPSAEATQRSVFVCYSHSVRGWFRVLGIGRMNASSARQSRQLEIESAAETPVDIEMGQVPQLNTNEDEDNELTSWASDMAKEVVKEMRAIGESH